ncbi:MAG: AmmeMemoRadiSam system protein A [Desulfobulbus sp.]|jgi:AmmeMemoRadiSam system protein A|nr:AmmeMemoRadiSam system protein A [Desulfobulbus sp.]
MLSKEQGQGLLRLARQEIEEQLGMRPATAEGGDDDPALLEQRGVFVTLHKNKALRGCIGSLAAAEPLAEGIRRNAVNAAFHDSRFAPLTSAELPDLHIEISILSEPQPLTYRDADDLIGQLRPTIDGVILHGPHGEQATFLPQVWQQLPAAELFLNHLCRKAELPEDAWRSGRLRVLTYQVQSFEEPR